MTGSEGGGGGERGPGASRVWFSSSRRATRGHSRRPPRRLSRPNTNSGSTFTSADGLLLADRTTLALLDPALGLLQRGLAAFGSAQLLRQLIAPLLAVDLIL